MTKSYTFDSAARVQNSGYSYDTLGRTLTTPQPDTGRNSAGPVEADYHADDMVAQLSQDVPSSGGGVDTATMTYALDPIGRVNAVTAGVNGGETRRLRYRFANDDDTPTSVETSGDGGATWASTRYITLPSLGTVASASGGVATFNVVNLHGDVVASMGSSSSITSYAETDEYGNALNDSATPQPFGWLGSAQRSGDALGGFVLMGARLYNPSTGAFLSPDPVAGGTPTAYAYPQDPVNQVDLTGMYTYWWGGVHHYSTSRWTPYTYARIWINVAGLSHANDAVAGVITALSLRLGLAKSGWGAVGLAIAGAITYGAGFGIKWLDRKHLGLGYRLYLTKIPKMFPIGGYAYLSSYAWEKGRNIPYCRGC